MRSQCELNVSCRTHWEVWKTLKYFIGCTNNRTRVQLFDSAHSAFSRIRNFPVADYFWMRGEFSFETAELLCLELKALVCSEELKFSGYFFFWAGAGACLGWHRKPQVHSVFINSVVWTSSGCIRHGGPGYSTLYIIAWCRIDSQSKATWSLLQD